MQIHEFEVAGLGKAPFKCVGVDVGHSRCQYCNTHIKYEFTIESSDGLRFIVGSDCVMKTSDITLRNQVNTALKGAKKKAKVDAAIRKNVAAILSGIMPFGKHKGKTFEAIAKEAPNYLLWFLGVYTSGNENALMKDAVTQIVTPIAQPLLDAIDAAEKAKQDLAAKSQYQHKIGEKVTVKLVLEKLINCGSFAYGGAVSYLHIFRDENDNMYSAYYSGREQFEKGVQLVITGTVKAHKDYQGMQQTVLTRIKKV